MDKPTDFFKVRKTLNSYCGRYNYCTGKNPMTRKSFMNFIHKLEDEWPFDIVLPENDIYQINYELGKASLPFAIIAISPSIMYGESVGYYIKRLQG